MSEILKEYDENNKKSDFFKTILKYFLATILVALFASYCAFVFFGERSLDVMLGLSSTKERLIKDIAKLKEANARLQKEYFELKELEPD